MLFVGNKRSLLSSGLSLAGKIKKLFSVGQAGAQYDFGQLAQEFQDSAGTVAVTAVEQALGLVLDWKNGYALGAELMTNGLFDANINGWVDAGSGQVWVNGVLRRVIGGDAGSYTDIPCIAGATYLFKVDILNKIGGGTAVANVYVGGGFSGQAAGMSSSGSAIFVASTSNIRIYLYTNSDSGADFDNVSVRQVSGNYLTQATAGARPTVSARVNFLKSTESFDDSSAWGAASITTANSVVAPNGLLTADTITAAGAIANAQILLAPAARLVFSVYAKKLSSSNEACTFGVYNNTAATALVFGNIDYDAVMADPGLSIESVGGGWVRVSIVLASGFAVGDLLGFYVGFAGAASGSGAFWGAQVEVGSVATPYQRINTASDYNTAGFPVYSKFDGVDDCLASAAGGGWTSGFFWCGAVKLLGVNASEQHIWSDQSGNNGHILFLNASGGPLSLAVGNGSALSIVASPTNLTIGETALITAWDDGVNLNIQVNSGSVATVARPSITAGTAGFSVGKSNVGANSYFNGNLYPSIIRSGTPLTATERAAAQAWCKSKAGL